MTETYTENTLRTVASILISRYGGTIEEAQDAITGMQNAGILFRERITTTN